MKILLVRFAQRQGISGCIPWHFYFYKRILEKDGHAVDIVDNQVRGLSIEELGHLMKSGGYQIVCTGGIGTVYSHLRDFCKLAKRLVPDVYIIVGGHIVADYEFILQHIPADILVLGEGEITLKKIVDAFSKGLNCRGVAGTAYLIDGSVVKEPPEQHIDLDQLPLYDPDDIPLELYNTSVPVTFLKDSKAKELVEQGDRFLSIYLARGCPYRCFFCYRHIPGYRTYSRGRLEQIFARLKECGFSFLSLGDECVTANKTNLRNICELAREYSVYWMTSGRADHVTDEMMSLLIEGNCVALQYGVESFDDGILRTMNKRSTAEQNIRALNMSYAYGIESVLQLVIGSPGESRKTLLNTRKGLWLSHLKNDKIACAVLNPYPGSPAYYYCIEHSYIQDRELVHEEFAGKGKIVVNMSDLSSRELKAWQQLLLFEAGVSYRIKNCTLLMNRSFLKRAASFLKRYLGLLFEPCAFLGFSYYLLMGMRYWFQHAPRTEIPADLRGIPPTLEIR